MALPTQQWRMSPAVVLAGPTTAAIIAAIKSIIDTGTDYNGNAFPFPWAYTIENTGVDVAIRLAPAAGSTDDLRVIIAGVAAGAPTPTMIANDTFAVATTLIGIEKGVAGGEANYTTWDTANPYTGGSFTGYARMNTLGTLVATHVRVYFGREGLVIALRNAAGTVAVACAGALCDPFSTNASDAESNGRLYDLYVSGGGQALGSAFWSQAAAGSIFQHDVTAGREKAVGFAPGAATVLTQNFVGGGAAIANALVGYTTTTAAQFKTAAAVAIARMNVPMKRAVAQQFRGNLRGISFSVDAILAQYVRNSGGVDLGYFVSGSDSAAQDALFLSAA